MSNKPRDKTNQNPVSSMRKTARKFLKPEVENKETSSKSRTNSDFIISAASRTKVLSNTALAIAENTREALKNLDNLINDSISSDTGDDKRGNKGTQYDVNDLEAIQKQTSIDIERTMNVSAIQNESVRKLYESASKNIIKHGIGTSKSKKISTSSKINKAVPVVDYLSLESSGKGQSDIFSVKLVFTLEASEIENNDIKAFRIFRARKNTPETTRSSRAHLSRLAMDTIVAKNSLTKTKNFAKFATFQQTLLDSRGISNALTSMTKVDGITGERHSLSVGEDVSFRTDTDITKNSNDRDSLYLKSFITNMDNTKIDLSVIQNLKAMKNLQLQNSSLVIKKEVQNVVGTRFVERDTVGRLSPKQVNDIREDNKNDSVFIEDGSNSSSYVELSVLSLSRIKNKRINNLVEFSYDDITVEFGETYTYYVTSIDNNMSESVRSRITKILVENINPPNKPSRLVITQNGHLITLSILANRSSNIEKFEIYRKESRSNKISDKQNELIVINGPSGFTTELVKRDPIGNGYIQVGEARTINSSGATFIDRTVVEGKKYTYRIYSVDIFGNKSQSPKSSIVFVNERSKRSDTLRKPTAIVEVDAKSNNVKVTIDSDDDRLVSFFLTRKNHTINEKTFTVPGESSHLKMGMSRSIKKGFLSGPVSNSSWTGFFLNSGKQIEFIDKLTSIDNIYQYCVYGVDRYGSKTSCEITRHIFVSRRPVVDRPINLKMSSNNDDTITISWEDSNLDIDPQDKIGNRDDLVATSYRTLFQVERRKVSEESWNQFPLVDTKEITDKIGLPDEETPTYRPDYLELDTEYLYRVATFQTGGFISNFSKPIKVNTFKAIERPTDFRINACDMKCEPYYTVLNWNTKEESGTVDKWKIERAVVNNFAASTLNVTNPSDVSKLKFEHIIDISKESSRSRSRVDDDRDSKGVETIARKNKVLIGDHHFIDNNVSFGNTYFYRLTAIGLNRANESETITRGIRITDSAFERKLNSVLTQKERNMLSKTREKLVLSNNVLRTHGYRESIKNS